MILVYEIDYHNQDYLRGFTIFCGESDLVFDITSVFRILTSISHHILSLSIITSYHISFIFLRSHCVRLSNNHISFDFQFNTFVQGLISNSITVPFHLPIAKSLAISLLEDVLTQYRFHPAVDAIHSGFSIIYFHRII